MKLCNHKAALICRKILREVKQSGEIHLVLDCDHDKIRMVMKEAMAVGMMTAYHNYLITNMVGRSTKEQEFVLMYKKSTKQDCYLSILGLKNA